MNRPGVRFPAPAQLSWLRHSSLARLRTLPFTELKLDRAFITEITDDGDCGPIITAVVALGLSAVAEGVETQVQLRALQRLGCDGIQGFLIARPVALDDLRLEAVQGIDGMVGSAEDQLVELVTRLRAYEPSAGEMPSGATATGVSGADGSGRGLCSPTPAYAPGPVAPEGPPSPTATAVDAPRRNRRVVGA